MASYVFMKILESAPRRYDFGINLISLGQNRKMQQEIVEKYIREGNQVLEIGCGTGTLAISCAKKGAKVVALDLSRQMLAIAERKVNEHNLFERIQLKEIGAIELGNKFKDNTFDRIVSTLVFSELYSDEQKYVLNQAYRILRSNGLIIIADEVKPRSLWKLIVHSSIRIPLALVTYLLTQTSTKALENIKDPMKNAGFKIIHEKRIFMDSFGLFVGIKE
jgi:demethylmenaquinone methyltransferase/2-methoxy-6-polyprenyl-1,4-benzoquinol methylase